jgi:hypothetical protein
MESAAALPGLADKAPTSAIVRVLLLLNRTPLHLDVQDVTIRLIAQKGILQGKKGELCLQGEAAMGKVYLPPPLMGRTYHLFCSEFNAGATEFAEELRDSSVFEKKGKKASAPLTFTSRLEHHKAGDCDHMIVLLDKCTWTSGEDTAKLVEHIHEAMWAGVHIVCVHEFPSLVGPERYDCEFNLMFGDDWTPAHLTGGKGNLYKEIALALKGAEWRSARFCGRCVQARVECGRARGDRPRGARLVPGEGRAKPMASWRDAALEEAQPLPRPDTPEVSPRPAPLVVADPVNERGSLVLEDDATFVQALAASSNVQPSPQEGAGLVQAVTARVREFFLPSASEPAPETDRGDLHA